MKRKRLTIDQYAQGVLQQDRVVLGQAITLVESSLKEDQELAMAVMEKIMPKTGGAKRIGLTGVPGVGKSTFIDVFGTFLTQKNLKVAVLAVDPTSNISHGSILGDKTRMERLSVDPLAFIRPSPASGSLGGVTKRTREAILLCEAAGFDIVIVETVGVGQSELAVHSMVDFFLLLMLPGAGDELQGIKKGIFEMADGFVINKADGDTLKQAKQAKVNYQSALHYFSRTQDEWNPEIVLCSSTENKGINEVWEMISRFWRVLEQEEGLKKKRLSQMKQWMEDTIRFLLEKDFFNHPEIKKEVKKYENLVQEGLIPPTTAAKRLIDVYFSQF